MSARAPLVALLGVVAVAAAFRFTALQRPDLTSDELVHLYAARGLRLSGRPALPSGTLYVRGRAYTSLVAGLLGRVPDELRFACPPP